MVLYIEASLSHSVTLLNPVVLKGLIKDVQPFKKLIAEYFSGSLLG